MFSFTSQNILSVEFDLVSGISQDIFNDLLYNQTFAAETQCKKTPGCAESYKS